MKSFVCLLVWGAAWLGCGRAVMAADPGDGDGQGDVAQPQYLVSFADQRRWNTELFATGLGDVTNRHVVMGGMTFGVGYYVLDNLAINLEATQYGFSEGRTDGAATALTLGLRNHLARFGNTSLFFDVAAGGIYATNDIPYRGTHLNITFDCGPGLAFPLRDDLSLIVGARFFHLSNHNSEGDARNPSVNALQGLVGVMYRF